MEQPSLVASECEFGASVRTDNVSRTLRPMHQREFNALLRKSTLEVPGLSRLPIVSNNGGYMYSNGARVYEDVAHPEYSGPLCTLDEIVAAEIAGEHVMRAIMLDAMRTGRILDFELNKRVVGESEDGSKLNGWGYHENYLCRRYNKTTDVGLALNKEDLELLGLHLATRNLYTGAGTMTDTGYAIAQKVLTLCCDFNVKTIDHKALVNMRDVPYAKPDKWVRVHVTSMDPNMSPWSTFMGFGTTQLVLLLSEYRRVLKLDGKLNDLHVPGDTMRHLARQVATDLTLQKTVERANGRTIRPIEIQQEILALIHEELPKVMDFSPTQQQVLDEADCALEILKRNPLELTKADWVAKYIMTRDYMAHKGIDDWTSKRLVGFERWYSTFRPDPNPKKAAIGVQLRSRPEWREWMPDEALIERFMTTPPQNSRARVIGHFVSRANEVGGRLSTGTGANWNELSVSRGDRRHQLWLGPYDTDVAATNQLIENYLGSPN